MSAPTPEIDTGLRRVIERLACPSCLHPMMLSKGMLACSGCNALFPIARTVLDLRPDTTMNPDAEADWSEHWSGEKQESGVQKFFSIYRKAVFARTVRFFTERYFPESGVFVEAGAGTSETSMLIDKHGGQRVLTAVDLVPAVLESTHPVMDVRVCADIFRMPFGENSLDGIWNVGVMEHFTQDQIDAIMREFHRTLKPGGRLILLWPAVFSIPQRILRCIEWFVHSFTSNKTFRFHPDEISQLRSIRQGRDVLARNGFQPLQVDPGVRSLMAFETIVGEKR